ncbi:hypothetical protein AgCh_026328 [Apium graveolens]
MNGAEQIVNARLAATRALNNALDFAQTNFQNEMERNFIMKTIFQLTLMQLKEMKKVLPCKQLSFGALP